MLSQRTANLFPTDMNQFLKVEVSESPFQNWIFPKDFTKNLQIEFEKNKREIICRENILSCKNFENYLTNMIEVFSKKIFENNIWKKIQCVEKYVLSVKLFGNYFSENEIFQNWSMAFAMWLFIAYFKGP